MTRLRQSSDLKDGADKDLLAIRALMTRQERVSETLTAQKELAQPLADPSKDYDQQPSFEPEADIRQETPDRSKRRTAVTLLRQRVLSYRPDRKVIFRTSLILLLLLQPFWVIGLTLALVGSVLLCHALMGAEAFWLRIIGLYRVFARRWPDHARAVKLRAYKSGKKWDLFLSRRAPRIRDMFGTPDLRHISQAETRHDQILSERLQRVREELAAD
ncbi:MAG: hypothetical protein AAF665_16805 [Pseudomonadota bacterium]